jgi:hypothetical protein
MEHMHSRFSAFGAVLAILLAAPAMVRAQSAVATYKAQCAGCHSADGKGNPAPGKALRVTGST